MAKEEHISGPQQPGVPPVDSSLIVPTPERIQIATPTRRRGRMFSALEQTGIPNTYLVHPKVLSQEEIHMIKDTLTNNDANRSLALLALQETNRETLSRISRVGILLDGRGQERNAQGQLVKAPDGWWGDTIQASSVIRAALAHGLEVEVFSTQPDLFSKEGGDAVSHTRIPDETFPFQFYPFRNNEHTELIEFLHSKQKPHMAFLAPTNARLPLYFRLEKHRGAIRHDAHTLAAVNQLQMAVLGEVVDNFEGITQKQWNKLCHHTQAYQVLTDILGLSANQWDTFPRPYVNPTPFATALAQDIAQQFSSTKITTLLHIGGATNVPRKKEKFYPVEKWEEVLSHIAAKEPDLIGSIIIFKPINQDQAAMAQKVADHAVQVFGEECVIVTPLQRDWNLSSLSALMGELANKGIVVGIDSGPGHLARAQNAPLTLVGNKAFDPEFYAPQGAMVILPAQGESARRVFPEDVAEAFIALAQAPLPN